MKLSSSFFLTLCFLAFPFISNSQQTAQHTGEYGYLEYLPPGYYDNPQETFPVIIFLHGSGERGDGSPEDLFSKGTVWGPPKKIKGGHNMCFDNNGVEECFIVISPQIPSGGWAPSITDHIVEHILNGPKNYKVDRGRVFMTGLSLGAGGTWAYAASAQNNPNKIAAMAPISGRGSTKNGCIISERQINIWAFHGDSDRATSYSSGLATFNAVKDCTDPVPSAELRFTTYERVGHAAWIRSYRTDYQYHNPNLYEWFLSKTIDAPGPPVSIFADAGPDQNIELPQTSTTLIGSGSTSEGAIASYSWQQISGPTATLVNSNNQELQVNNLQVGSSRFRLTVTTDGGIPATDDVIINLTYPGFDHTDSRYLELTADGVTSQTLISYYDSQKSNGNLQPVTMGGNDQLTFLLKTVTGTPKWDRMEVKLTAQYQTRTVQLAPYLLPVASGDWTKVSIPLVDFGHDPSRLVKGVSNFQLKVVGGFGDVTFALDEVKYEGGSDPFVWYGNAYEQSAENTSIDETSQFFISKRPMGTPDPDPAPNPDPDPINGSSYLEITANNSGGDILSIHYNAQKGNVVVTEGGNDAISFMVKPVDGTPDWSKMELRLRVGYQTRSVYLGTYIDPSITDWQQVTIPITDFMHDPQRWDAGVSNFQFKMRSGFGNVVFALDEIVYTGGSSPFIWYGDEYTTSGEPELVDETANLYISDRVMVADDPDPIENNYLEMTTINSGGKNLILYYTADKSNAVRLPVTETGNDKLTFSIKVLSGSPNWQYMNLAIAASFQNRSVPLSNYITSSPSDWTTVEIPLTEFAHSPGRLEGGVSNFQLKMLSGFGDVVFAIDDIIYSGGTTPFVWYGQSYEISGSPEATTESAQFYISNRASSTARLIADNNTESESGELAIVYDMHGREIIRKELNHNDESTLQQQLRLRKGFYIIHLQGREQLKSVKLFVN